MAQPTWDTDPVTVTVLIPSHNEETILPTTLPALLSQSRRPDRVIVVADNCTDGTVTVAAGTGWRSFETVGNTEKKAGALNQALARILPDARRQRRGDGDGRRHDARPGLHAEAVRRFETIAR